MHGSKIHIKSQHWSFTTITNETALIILYMVTRNVKAFKVIHIATTIIYSRKLLIPSATGL